MSQEIKQIADNINKEFHELKDRVAEIDKKGDDAISTEALNKVTEEITTKLDTLQKEQAEMKAASQRLDREDNGEDFAEDKKAFNDFMRDVKGGRKEIEVRAMSTDNNPDGGYLVRPELSNFIIDRVFETSPLRQVARVETIGTKSLEILIDDNEAGADWVGEGSGGSETDTPELGLKEITAHKIAARPKVTEEQIQDSYLDVENWLQGKVADKIGRTSNTAFVSGNGVAKPRGFLTYDAASDADVYERDAIGQVNLGATSFGGTAAADGLIELQNKLKEPYQANAVFGVKRETYGEILKSKGTDNYFFGMQLLKDGQLQPTLLGKPVVFMDDMPAVASAALSVVYADFSVAYTIVDRVGLQVLRDPYTSKGFVEYYTTLRVGGDVTNYDAIKLGKMSA